MVQIIKSGTIKVPTQPKDFDLKATGLVFKSYDNQVALEFNVEKQDGTPADLLGANLRLLMFIYDEIDGTVTKEPIPFITKNLITESFLNGHVVYILPEAMKAYNGMVEAYVYIEYPDGSTSDNLGFTFRMKRSAIDGLAQDKADYFIADFQQLLDVVKQEATDAVNEVTEQLQATQTKIDAKVKDTNDKITKANQDVATLNTNIDKANDRIDQTNQQIGDLGKLKKMYSNSIDFGDYDYSGRANLMINLDFSKLSGTNYMIQTPPPYIKDGGTYFVLDASDASAANTTRNVFIPFLGRLEKGATYMVTIPMMISEDFGTDYGSSPIYPYNVNDGATTTRSLTMTPNADCREKWQFVEKAFTVPSNMTDGKFAPFLQVYQNKNQTGKLYIGYDIKIEKVTSTSDTATPYQPNLLDAPYYLSKVALGENIITSKSYDNSNYLIGSFDINKTINNGDKLTFTIQGTKPANKQFGMYIQTTTGAATEFQGHLTPVEGLTDVWSWSSGAKISKPIGSGAKVVIYQLPPESQVPNGKCTILWAKLEEGDTRTPNTSEYKYFGEGLKDSNNPNDYSWDVTPEYTEKGLNNTVSLTEPQSVEGLKNFEDGLQVGGKEVATVPEDTGWVNLTAINGHSWNKQGQIRRIGKLVMFRGSLKGSTLSTQDFCTIPEGFRPSNPTDNYEYQFLLPPQSSNTLDNGGMAYIRPNGVCGLPSFRGTVNLFLAPIQYYID
ncbi:BppU family phage baseplate upper protein [Enterococcus faecium]|uniref:BppU family phage baseplate upper protein n=1 Tax=Enterococcus faecium TaxID=1352 RepID=UPI0010BE14EF|nr:BppU family phage baseplate upper protein [Enterococcus faecium]QCK24245.1 DUF2479 domain-containing protein [Enterococcus faecium]